MIDLDDERTIAAGDPGGMLRAIAHAPAPAGERGPAKAPAR